LRKQKAKIGGRIHNCDGQGAEVSRETSLGRWAGRYVRF
jgi:hypothetical protein